MENATTNGQYGKRNPLFMYQRTAGYSVRAELETAVRPGKETLAIMADPYQSGERRCGMLQNERKE